MQRYSELFQTLHDETQPTGYLGRGTHYSVLRCLTWLGKSQHNLKEAVFHDFAVIWDEDHDIRVIKVIEKMYLLGMLAPVLFIGERKGSISILFEEDSLVSFAPDEQKEYRDKIEGFTDECGDFWNVELNDPCAIIQDDCEAVSLYLQCIKTIWRLGIGQAPK